MRELTRHFNGSADLQAGYWRESIEPDGVKTAQIRCPSCHRLVYLDPKMHSIDEKGVVSPSLVCPFADCFFHDYVRLRGWHA